ncbi:YybH family protein [Sutcliffiella rhizosphaerae]|uniref:DUF4440 domain-containing protein n=1 Tax=Sutcliffiella rhizosphaerae TaxID=2880967 RepID=A0ABN8A954_9BACI|nr:nuclear transport factor 2 family protein [Sutcliffiella rhizosphaerae]CAG9621244.1 hypothetical protein BACCIP111883_02016 [Sutcliffiella rhizosphaerae]
MNHEQALHAYIEATNTHDFTQVEKHLHPNAVYWFTRETCTTISEIRSFFEKTWDTIKDEKYSAENVEWIVAETQTAVCLYTYRYEGYLNGEFVSGSGRATNVFVKEAGNWLLKHEHLSR